MELWGSKVRGGTTWRDFSITPYKLSAVNKYINRKRRHRMLSVTNPFHATVWLQRPPAPCLKAASSRSDIRKLTRLRWRGRHRRTIWLERSSACGASAEHLQTPFHQRKQKWNQAGLGTVVFKSPQGSFHSGLKYKDRLKKYNLGSSCEWTQQNAGNLKKDSEESWSDC